MSDPVNDDDIDMVALGHPDAPEPAPQQQEPAAPEPEAQTEAPEAPEQPTEPQPPAGFIPASRFKEVREKQKAAERQAQEAMQAAAQMRARLEALERGQQAPQAQAAPEKPDPEPDKAQNYVEWLEWRDRQNEKRFREVENWRQEQARVQQQQAAEMQLAAAISPMIQQFRAQAPDYDQALGYFREQLTQKVATSGQNPAMAPQVIHAFETQLAQFATAWGLNPAPLMYQAAKAWGYGAQAADDDGDDAGDTRPRDASGRFLPVQTAAAAPKPAPAPVRSLGNAAGAPSGGAMTLERWNQLSDAQQVAFEAKHGRAAVNRLLGG